MRRTHTTAGEGNKDSTLTASNFAGQVVVCRFCADLLRQRCTPGSGAGGRLTHRSGGRPTSTYTPPGLSDAGPGTPRGLPEGISMMTERFRGQRIAILATDGVEEIELTEPRRAITDQGALTEIVSVAEGSIQAMKGDLQPTNTYPVDRVASPAIASEFDALIMPGGTVNGDRLRMNPNARSFVTAMFAAANRSR